MPATRNRRKLSKAADNVPFWYHSIDLGNGIVSSGKKSAEQLAKDWEALGMPDMRGKSVLDVGAWDGYFSFRAEEAGASRVVALDHYMWSLDLARQQDYLDECAFNNQVPAPFHTMPSMWKPDQLPGKVGFDTAHRARGSKVESVVGDLMTMDLDRLGTFDVVLYVGVFSRMRHPLLALERLAKVTGEVLLVQTEAVVVPGFEHKSFCEFFETNELRMDTGLWWAPNRRALTGMCRAAGFPRVESRDDVRSRPSSRDALHRYPLTLRAWRRASGQSGPAVAGAPAGPPPPD